jgi:hypothetical protein
VSDTNGDGAFVVDINKLKLGDLEDLAEFIGPERMARLTKGEADPKTLVGLAWIVKRQTIPGFTLDDARALPLSAIALVEDRSGVDPTGSGDSASSPPSASTPA